MLPILLALVATQWITVVGATVPGTGHASSTPPVETPPAKWHTVTQIGEYEVRLINVKAESFFDGLNGSVNTSLNMNFLVACPATQDSMGLQRNVVLSALEDENGQDLLKRLNVPPESQRGFPSHPFAETHRVKEADGRIMFRRSTSFYAKDVQQLPQRLRRIAGTVSILRPKAIQTFDFEAAPGDVESEKLRELVPGLWLAISRKQAAGAHETTMYSWLCNRIPDEYKGRPDAETWAAHQSLSSLQRWNQEDAVGHDPSQPPAIVGIWEHRDGTRPMDYFSMQDYGLGKSGIYSSSVGPWTKLPKGLRPLPHRVAVATEFERIDLPFEFRDVPLSLGSPEK